MSYNALCGAIPRSHYKKTLLGVHVHLNYLQILMQKMKQIFEDMKNSFKLTICLGMKSSVKIPLNTKVFL